MSTQQALNAAMKEAVEFIHAEGWDEGPTLFALVDTQLLIDDLPSTLQEDTTNPYTLVVQDNLPDNLPAGSNELADYCSRIAWPEQVAGAILAQEIIFRDTNDPDLADPRQARLFSGVLRQEGIELTLLQLRPTEAEIEERGPFAEDEISLRGGDQIAPGILVALRMGLERDPEDFLE